ncbi:MAG: phosphate signaling complex protein PhoU [Eubacteriaceae bacterium]|nr:phosphate signaling complex protein PhoU [Eubacteriaceae bacterium]
MRESYTKMLDKLHNDLISMGQLCEEAITNAISGLMDEDNDMMDIAIKLEAEIDIAEREIDFLCTRLLLREQPVAGDLRQISTAQRMITDLERIGDQARDIAELSKYLIGSKTKSAVKLQEMAIESIKMLTDGIQSFVVSNVELANDVIKHDDIVDSLFVDVKSKLASIIIADANIASEALDILMIAKYLERIADHAVNIAEWSVYSITGQYPELH